jgi:hypothetical protein
MNTFWKTFQSTYFGSKEIQKKKTQITDQAARVPSQVPTNKLISNAAKF